MTVFMSLFSTVYYTTESTPWTSYAAGLHCATQLSKPVIKTSIINCYRLSYKITKFQTYVLCYVGFFTYFELYLSGCFNLHLAHIGI